MVMKDGKIAFFGEVEEGIEFYKFQGKEIL